LGAWIAHVPEESAMPLHMRLVERGATPEQTREITIRPPEFLIGRGSDCDLRLPGSGISRHHCLIRVGPDGVTLVDLGSSNGTYLNGQRVLSQAPLQGGEELRVGASTFLVDLGAGAGLPEADPMARTVRLPKDQKGGKPPG
jgi:pSer/pThr/pTyr-binding forkhead associated (FHA) protein